MNENLPYHTRLIRHLETVREHRNLVRRNCFACGLYSQGLKHDLSKYSPSEFLVSVRFFQGYRSPYMKEKELYGFSEGWLHHKGRNPHHWEYWYDMIDGKWQPIRMPYRYIVEMVCDRVAACRVYLKDKYNVPYYMGMPLGLRATRKWLVEIGEHFGLKKEAERLADYEEKMVLEAIAPYKEKLKGKRVMISGGSVRSAVEASLIHDDLGMEIVSVIGLLYDSNAEVVFEDLAKEHPEVPVVVSDQPYEFVNQVKTYKPDIVLCHANGLAEPAKLGVVTVPEFDVGGAYFGYNGVFQVARQLVFALENHSYVTEVSKHVKFPYKQSWYEKDPFAYLKD